MKIYIETLGCPKNQNDSQKVAALLERSGHEVVGNPESAQGIIVNTCGFINDAKVESINTIFDMASYKPELLIVSGCLSQRYGEELYKEMPEVDIFLGVNDYPKINDIIKKHEKGSREKYISRQETDIDSVKRKLSKNQFSATLKISEGCDNACTYCIIPKIRGKYRSRPMEEIVEEAKLLVDNGVKEIILIGQDVTAYGIDLYDELILHELVAKLCKLEDLRWLRLMYCYEDRITDELISTMAKEDKVCKYIDIPIQHASKKILKNMGRRGGRESIDKVIGKLRKAMPDIAIRTTLIVGFPGETEKDYEELLDFVEETKFNRLGVFAYSAEDGTPAANMNNQIDDKVKEERLDGIMRLQMDISLENNKKQIGKVHEAIIESIEDDSYIGRTGQDAPEIDNGLIIKIDPTKAKYLIGDIVKVKIIDAFDYDLVGKII